jgi:hypothetical protein
MSAAACGFARAMAASMEPVKQILDELGPIIRRCASGKMQADGAFLVCVRAALAKNFEVNCFVQSREGQSNAFAVTSALRGICEDIIVLKWLGTFTKRDRDEAVGVLMMKNVLEFMQQQTAFFNKYRPSQPILEAKDVSSEIQGLKLRLRGFRKSYKWKKHREWPSIREMAQSTDLLPLYDFLYAGTTSFVHFSPNNLIRMGKMSAGEKMSFSTANFSEYYNAFNRFYGLFLFVTFCTTFAKLLECVDEIRPAIEKLMRHIDEELRWPELVTMEEMNVPAVSQMLRLMAHNARKFGTAATVWEWHDLG